MRGGVKFFAGAPAAARHYVEADRGRADDYCLAEGPASPAATLPGGRERGGVGTADGKSYAAWGAASIDARREAAVPTDA